MDEDLAQSIPVSLTIQSDLAATDKPIVASYSSWIKRSVPVEGDGWRMGIVSDSLPSWIFLSDNLTNCKLDWIAIPQRQSHWTHLLPKTTRVIWIPDPGERDSYPDWMEAIGSVDKLPDIVIFEGRFRPPRRSVDFWSSTNLQLVLSDKGLRGPSPDEWNAESQVLDHVMLGGVTGWKRQIHAWTKANDDSTGRSFFKAELLVGAESSFQHVVDRTRTGKRVREGPAPNETNVVDCEAIQRKRKKRWTVPTVYGKDFYVQRPLTTKEASLCLDLPSSVSKHMSAETIEVAIRNMGSPVKIATALGACVLNWTAMKYASGHFERC